MFLMERPIPLLALRSEYEAGRVRVIYTFSSTIFNEVLQSIGAQSADEIEEHSLREMCRGASPTAIDKILEASEEKAPGQIAMVLDTNASGEDVMVTSGDLGLDMLKRFMTEPLPDDLFDPTYSTVDLEIRVRKNQPEGTVDHLGECMLRRTLSPPNLA